MPRRTLAEQLQSCLEPLKPEVIHGVLAGLFATLGAEFASKQLEDRLQALDLCILPALSRLDIVVSNFVNSDPKPTCNLWWTLSCCFPSAARERNAFEQRSSRLAARISCTSGPSFDAGDSRGVRCDGQEHQRCVTCTV